MDSWPTKQARAFRQPSRARCGIPVAPHACPRQPTQADSTCRASLLVLGVGLALTACDGATASATGGAQAGSVAQSSGGTQATDGAVAPELCTERASWTQTGVDPAELFPGTGTAELTYPEGTRMALARRCSAKTSRPRFKHLSGRKAGGA